MKIYLALFLVLFSLLFVLRNLEGKEMARIKVWEDTKINSEKIYLGEIAEIKGDDLQLIQKLRAIYIGLAPLPHNSRQFKAEYIKARLKQNRIDFSQIAFFSPPQIKVTRGYLEISKEKIREIARNFISKEIPWGPSKVKIRNIYVSEDLILPEGEVSYQVIPPRNHDFLGSTNFSILFLVDGEVEKKVWVTADIEIVTEVVISNRQIKRYQTISEEDVHMEKRNLSYLSPRVITSLEEVIGKRAKATIDADKVLRIDLIETPPLIKKKDIIIILAESENLRVITKGEAREDGYKGKRIKVKNLNSQREIEAEVIDSSMVKVDF